MSTTTIRLPDELKARVESLASARGGSVHGFMVEAIAAAADQEERHRAFLAEAERRARRMERSGQHLSHEDLRAYALALARGEKPAPPEPQTLAPEELARLRSRGRRGARD